MQDAEAAMEAVTVVARLAVVVVPRAHAVVGGTHQRHERTIAVTVTTKGVIATALGALMATRR